MGTVLITGANRGIGLATAIELARRGQRVFAGTRDLRNADAIERAADDSGVEIEPIEMDVSSSDSVCPRRASRTAR